MKRLKKYLASAVIVSMLVTGMSIPSFAENSAETEVVSKSVITKGSEKLDGLETYYANGYPSVIEEKGGTTYIHVEGDDTLANWVDLGQNGDKIVYAGSVSGVLDSASVTMESGKIRALIGGSSGTSGQAAPASEDNKKYDVGTVEITVNGGEIFRLYMNRSLNSGNGAFAKNGEQHIGNAKVTIGGNAEITSLYGAFGYTSIDSLEMNVTGNAKVDDLLLGATNGYVENGKLTVDGAGVEIGSIAGCQRTLVENASINLIKGKVKGGINVGSAFYDGERIGNYKKTDGSLQDSSGMHYGVVKHTEMFVGSEFEYKGIYGGFQYVPEDVKMFGDYFSQHGNENVKNIVEEYGLNAKDGKLETTATIKIAAQPQKYSGKLYNGVAKAFNNPSDGMVTYEGAVPNLLTEKVDGVTVTYMPAGLSLDKEEAAMKIGDTLSLTATVKKLEIATPSTPSVAKRARVASGSEAEPSDVRIEWSEAGEDQILEITEESVTDEETGIVEKSVATIEAVGSGKTTVTAKLYYGTEEEPVAEASAEITVEVPKFKFEKSSVTIDLADTQDEVLWLACDAEYEPVRIDYELDRYDIIDVIYDGDNHCFEIMPTEEAEGTTKLTVTIGDFVAPITLTATIKVKDSREIKLTADGKPIKGIIDQLDVNEEAEKRSQALSADTGFNGDVLWEIEDPTVAELSAENGYNVTITALKEGTTALTVTTSELPAYKEPLTVDVVVKDSTKKAEAEGKASEITVNLTADEIAAPEVEEELPAEVEEQLAADTISLAETALGEVAENSAVKDTPVKVSNNAGSALANAGLVEDGEKAVVGTAQELLDMKMDVNVSYKTDEAGNQVVEKAEPFISGLTFEVNAMVERQSVEGAVIEEAKAFNPDKKFYVTFRLPIPGAVDKNYAKVEHVSDKYGTETSYVNIREENGSKYVEIRTNHFSQFILTFTNTKPSGGTGSSGGGGGSTPRIESNGTWHENETGWWFVKKDGTYPADTWYECYWNGAMHWYHFNAEGYLDAGWFTDKDGLTYFLHDQHDNRFGYMYTGWNWINGKCYYFMPYQQANGLKQGALVKNGLTPDGYSVNENGEWTVDGAVQTK